MVNQKDINNIFSIAFIQMTKSVANIELKINSTKEPELEHCISGIIVTKGIFNSTIVCHMEETVVDKLTYFMNGNKTLSEAEVEFYIKEYLNITCGRAISKINNLIKKSSRFTVPTIVKGRYIDDVIYTNTIQDTLFFDTLYGAMKVSISYLLPTDD